MQNPASAHKIGGYFNRVLFGIVPDVERLWNLHDTKGKGVVSICGRITMGRDHTAMLNGNRIAIQ